MRYMMSNFINREYGDNLKGMHKTIFKESANNKPKKYDKIISQKHGIKHHREENV